MGVGEEGKISTTKRQSRSEMLRASSKGRWLMGLRIILGHAACCLVHMLDNEFYETLEKRGWTVVGMLLEGMQDLHSFTHVRCLALWPKAGASTLEKKSLS